MNLFRITPAEGRTVHFEDGKRVLKAGGEDLSDSPHWQRRLMEGDVTIMPIVEPKKKA